MNLIGIRRKEIKLNQAITEWLKGDHSERQIVLMISLMVGVCTGLTAFVLKSLIEEIKHLLTSGFAVEDMNLLYLVFPAVGILLAMLFVTYIVRCREVGAASSRTTAGRALSPAPSPSVLVVRWEPRHRLC